MTHQFENFGDTSNERLTEEETAAILKLWEEKQSRRGASGSLPTVRDIAEGLQAPPAEIEQMLMQVRERKAAELSLKQPSLYVTPHSMFKWPIVIAVLIAVVIAIALFSVRSVESYGPISETVSFPPPVAATEDNKSVKINGNNMEIKGNGKSLTINGSANTGH